MPEIRVQLFGFPQDIAPIREVAITLADPATLTDVIANLRKSVPTLVGFAIMPDEDRLVENFKFNHNGRLVYTDFSSKVSSGDHIALLIQVSGG
jgi:molybdopterin converting factor small subunit